MFRAPILVLLALVAGPVVVTQAFGQGKSQEDHGNGNGNGNGNNQGQNNGNGNGNNGNGNNGNNDGGQSSNPAPTPSPIGSETPDSSSSPGTDSERALDAVRSQRALPLEDIVGAAQADHPGKLIDARLIAIDNTLLYEIKLLEPDGQVVRLYYYAKSGREVRQD